jgi:hypothetical protein
MSARERLHGKMNSLMPFQVMVSVEALGTLIALERAVIRRLLLWWVTEHVAHACGMPAVESWDHLVGHATHKGELAVGIGNVGKDWCLRISHGTTVRPLIGMGRLRRRYRRDAAL